MTTPLLKSGHNNLKAFAAEKFKSGLSREEVFFLIKRSGVEISARQLQTILKAVFVRTMYRGVR